MTRLRRTVLLLCLVLVGPAARPARGEGQDPLAPMKFNDVREVAPGVFFRYSSIGPDGSKIAFGGSNNIWVVFKDYVVVVDANFPKEAGDVLAAIRKTTDKPVRYVLDTHHHGDHAYGNAVFAAAGAGVVAQANCARLLRVDGPRQWAEAGRGPAGRKDVKESSLRVPDVVFDDKLVLDDGTQRVEFLFLGHAHTAGDAFTYLPRYKMLATGDACVNGAYNFMGHSDSASWVRVLERAQHLEVKYVLPGHGPVAGKELLEKQKRYFVELRQHVRKGVDAGQGLEDIARGLDLPWYKAWTTVAPARANIEHVYNEFTGRVTPWDLVEDFGLHEGPSPTRESTGWKAPRRIVVPNLMPARLAELKRLAPEVEFVPVKDEAEAARAAAGADAVVGFCTPEVARAGNGLRWIQVGQAGMETYLAPEVVKSPVVLTNTKKMSGPPVADQAFALLLRLTRGDDRAAASRQELHGKTLLVVGLGGVGTNVARRGQGFGMRVLAVDPRDMETPPFVTGLGKPERLREWLPKADVVVLCCPLTDESRGMIGAGQLEAMKKGAYLVNVGRGGLVKTDALVAALKEGRLAGVGLDVTDPEPLPADHPLRSLPGVVISPHVGAVSPETKERQWRLWRENIRRFVAGEPLLGVVDKARGY